MTQTETMTFSQPRLLLHLEGLALLIAIGLVYGQFSGDWLMFALLLFVPDVSMVGYLVNTRVGATVYNLAHFVVFPLILIGLGVSLPHPILVSVGLIWLAHIALDRTLGYGLKYNTAFKDTHMQHV
ncbi:DUF4260 domain-containing protein [Phototrophicus methaneseepsis]|uniref:DUF4260 domain-containing protein n=2 Tax=Phototrophicus methaneseepsis TaxID=2710758 RepID=A0A7S8IGS9_9CHLR|nr:DUF4260 domain-containing protein [Phototrophicus methaneseepsis]